MNKILIGLFIVIMFSSCATIIGGAKYKATVHVNNAGKANIYYNGQSINNNSQLLIKRKDANRITFKVEKEGYKTESFHFRKISFRGFALFTSIISGIGVQQTSPGSTRTTFFPWVLIDLINYSSLWKPNLSELGVSKINYKNYRYNLDYQAISISPPKEKPKIIVKEEPKDEFTSMTDKLRDLKKLLDEEIINKEEYNHLKKKLIGIESDNTSPKETSVITEQKTEVEKDNLIKDEPVLSEQETPLSKEDTEKLKDLNKMKELGIISETEYLEMKDKLIDNK